MSETKVYADVLLPLRLRGRFTYLVPESMRSSVKVGSWVMAPVRGKLYLAVVEFLSSELRPGLSDDKLAILEPAPDMVPVSKMEIAYWHTLADYYLCTVGEVFKSAYANWFALQSQKKRVVSTREKEYKTVALSDLTASQQESFHKIADSFAKGKNVLLHGVTGSGKTEIYMHLAKDVMAKGKSVLYLVPEIALSRQLEERLRRVFGKSLKLWHSKCTSAARKRVLDGMKGDDKTPYIVLGTRSAVLLPFDNLGLIIVDEEHDASYKQDSPAPRYNGRDSALMLASLHKAHALLGSATPSMESFYNVSVGKLVLVTLSERYYNGEESRFTIIDMNKACRLHNLKGSFSMQLINLIAATLKNGKQVMVFRSRRAYSSFVQCGSCGHLVKCPNCNVGLTYHKYNNSLSCHYCGFRMRYSPLCTECGAEMVLRGAGTERLEEELTEYFPNARVARLDADVSLSKKAEAEIIKDFEEGNVDILVGTQMISKGFDFERLALVVVMNADSLLSVQDFRGDEKAFSLLRQLSGRTGRRGESGHIVVQTFQPDHPLLQMIATGQDTAGMLLAERRQFKFPPFVRMLNVVVRSHSIDALRLCTAQVQKIVNQPASSSGEMSQGDYTDTFCIRLPRTTAGMKEKKRIAEALEALRSSIKGPVSITIDVDPQ